MLVTEAARARSAISRTFADIGYITDPTATRAIARGVMRDLQARRLRPNVSVPSRRNPMKFVQVMRAETGSMSTALISLLHDGSWTSSGGSFRLAEQLGVDLPRLCEEILRRNGGLRYLEIGAGWAGLRSPLSNGTVPRDVAGLAKRYQEQLGQSVHLHLTNLTPWHPDLPDGVTEHPYVTAASLKALVLQGVPSHSIDVIFSQAAAYFETDHIAFLNAAMDLLAPGGTMIFNHRPELSDEIDAVLESHGIRAASRLQLGGMNGAVVRIDRPERRKEQRTLAAYDPAFRPSAIR